MCWATSSPSAFCLAAGADWLVSRASANLADFIGLKAEKALGQPLTGNLHRKGAARHPQPRHAFAGSGCGRADVQPAPGRGRARSFDVALHFSGDQIVIEAEPAAQDELEASAMVRAMIARVSQSNSMAAYLREGARQVRALDRLRPGDGLSLR